ncbi:MAG: pantoate--beta-alanine ligase [Solirubrobacteraceae bacterium]|jgi:pantoate--beta-alanine ligase
MRTVRTIAELREALTPARRGGELVGLVATMGALHDGHRSLLAAARAECGVVVMSLFVNPTQFTSEQDLAAYPRDEAADAQRAQASGVDFLFAPAAGEMYPDGFATSVVVRGITERLEGIHRGAQHFDGVATVVTKLLNIVAPDVAYFGQKDAQQALVIKRLVADLDIATRIVVCPTVREPDGLARSSRNAQLSRADRARAVGLSRALHTAVTLISGGERDSDAAAAAARAELARHDIDSEYFAIVDPDTLVPVARIDGPVLLAVAATVGSARLIDNVLATPTPDESR